MNLNRFLFILVISVLSFSGTAYSAEIDTLLGGHLSNVESVAYSPNGKRFASGDWHGNINLYELDSSGKFVFERKFSGHLGAITSLRFSRKSNLLVSCSKDYSVRIWNLDSLDKHKLFNPHTQLVTVAFVDPSGKYLITGSEDGTVVTTGIYNPKKRRELKVGGPVSDVTVTKNFRFLYVALKGGTIKKFEAVGKNSLLVTFTGHKDNVNSLQLAPDEKTIASGSNDKTIIIWDVMSGKALRTLTGFEWKVVSIDYTRDGKYIVGGCNDGNTLMFETAEGKQISSFSDTGNSVRCVCFSPDGTKIAVATQFKGIDFYGAVVYKSGVAAELPHARGARPKGTGTQRRRQ